MLFHLHAAVSAKIHISAETISKPLVPGKNRRICYAFHSLGINFHSLGINFHIGIS